MEKKPCLVALAAEAALPSGVQGPVEFWALAWLAARCADVDIFVGLLFVPNVAWGADRAKEWRGASG